VSDLGLSCMVALLYFSINFVFEGKIVKGAAKKKKGCKF
jgi:hypothetical protein